MAPAEAKSPRQRKAVARLRLLMVVVVVVVVVGRIVESYVVIMAQHKQDVSESGMMAY